MKDIIMSASLDIGVSHNTCHA